MEQNDEGNLMLSDNLTVCIPVYNEEKRIESVIRNFIGKFKVLVIDDIPASTDRTREICEKFGVEYIQINKHGRVFESEFIMNAIWDKVETDYMLKAFCAEYIPDKLLVLYAKIANEKSYDVVSTTRISITSGKHILVWGNPRKSIIRYFSPRFSRRDSISYVDNVIHQEGKIICKKERILKTPRDIHLMFYQFRDYDTSWTEVNHGKYNDINAMQFYQKGKRYSFIKMISESLAVFFRDYFFNGAYKQGHLGFMHAYYRFHLIIGIYLRMWDIEHNLQKDQITELHNSIRAKLLSKEISVESLVK